MPRAWWILWRGDEAVGQQIGQSQLAGGAITLVGAGLPGGPQHRIARFEQATPPSEGHAFVFAATPEDRLTLLAIGIRDSTTFEPSTYLVSDSLQLNGGAPGPWPPTAFAARLDRESGTGSIVGWGMQDSDGADLFTPSRTSVTANQVVRRTEREIEFSVPPLAGGFNQAVLHHPEQGWVDTVAIASDPASEPQSTGGARLIVWFMPGLVSGSWSPTLLSLESVVIHSPELQALIESAGVTGLRRLHRDPKPSRNPLGERTFPVSMQDVYLITTADTAGANALSAAITNSGLARTSNVLTTRPSTQSPNDPFFDSQWGLHTTSRVICRGWTQSLGCHLGLDGPYGLPASHARPDIALLDTGVPTFHEDLSGGFGYPKVYYPAANFTNSPVYLLDINGHASASAAIISAATDNGIGMAAVSPGSVAWGFKVLDDYGNGEWDWIEDGIEYTQYFVDEASYTGGDIRLINLPLGETDGPEETLGATCRNARVAGQLLMAAIGNTDAVGSGKLPARLDASVCAVGANWINGLRWTDDDITGENGLSGQTQSVHLDLTAPGGVAVRTARLNSSPPYYDNINCPPNIPSFMPWTGATSAGTSTATGAAALLLQVRPEMLGEDAQRVLEITAADLGPTIGWDTDHGYGRVNPVAGMTLIGAGSRLAHDVIGGEGAGALSVDSSGVFENREFRGVPGLVDGTRSSMKYRLAGVATWNIGATSPPYAWTRTSGTVGWRDSSVIDNYRDAPDAGIVGAIATTHMVCETFAYRIVGSGGEHLAWFPDEPATCQIAYTVLGAPGTVGVEDRESPTTRAALELPRSVGGAIDLVVTAPRASDVRVEVCDVSGRRVADLFRGRLDGNPLRLTWRGEGNGHRVASGVYFIRLRAGADVRTARAVFLR